MYRKVIILCMIYTNIWGIRFPTLNVLPSTESLRNAGRVFAEGMGDGFAVGIAQSATGPLADLRDNASELLAKNLPQVSLFTANVFKRTDKLLKHSATLFDQALYTAGNVFNRSVLFVAAVSAGWVIWKKWYTKEKKYTLPHAITRSWNDIIEPAYIRDALLQKVQFIKLVRSVHKKSGYGFYRPLLLSGERGTGKSAIAHLIARESGMKVAYISSAHCMQFSAENCFAEIYHLISDATLSKECLIVIDNLDDFFMLHDQAFVNKTAQLFIEVISSNKNRCMIVGITRDKTRLPQALRDCFEDCIDLKLPDYQTRKELLLHYRKIYSEKYKDVLKKPLEEYFTDEELDLLAQSAENVSGAKLESIVSEIVVQATMA